MTPNTHTMSSAMSKPEASLEFHVILITFKKETTPQRAPPTQTGDVSSASSTRVHVALPPSSSSVALTHVNVARSTPTTANPSAHASMVHAWPSARVVLATASVPLEHDAVSWFSVSDDDARKVSKGMHSCATATTKK